MAINTEFEPDAIDKKEKGIVNQALVRESPRWSEQNREKLAKLVKQNWLKYRTRELAAEKRKKVKELEQFKVIAKENKEVWKLKRDLDEIKKELQAVQELEETRPCPIDQLDKIDWLEIAAELDAGYDAKG